MTALALFGEPKYKNGFEAIDYVCKTAPKDGNLRLARIGSYDNFNPFASRGETDNRMYSLFETLFTVSEDENQSYYPLLAQNVPFSPAYNSALVGLNPRAYFLRMAL